MPRMPVKALREFECILPPMELQEQFVALSEQSDKSKSMINIARIQTCYLWIKQFNWLNRDELDFVECFQPKLL